MGTEQGIPMSVLETEPTLQSPEEERVSIASVSMNLARHSLKGPKPREALSQAGMDEAVKAGLTGEEMREHFGQIFGSPRERTGQSSVLRMFADQLRNMNFDDTDAEDVVRWFIDEGGIQKTETPFLNFELGDGAYKDALVDSVKNGTYLTWIIDESDDLAKENKQSNVTPLTIQSGNVASFFFARVWELYDSLEKGEAQSSRVEDFVTSHQGVFESFLYKVILKHDGEDEARAFVENLGGSGFAENQGFRADVKVMDKDDANAWRVDIVFGDRSYSLEPNEIFAMMEEGHDFQAKLDKLSV